MGLRFDRHVGVSPVRAGRTLVAAAIGGRVLLTVFSILPTRGIANVAKFLGRLIWPAFLHPEKEAIALAPGFARGPDLDPDEFVNHATKAHAFGRRMARGNTMP